MTNVSLLSVLLHTSNCYSDSILLLDAHIPRPVDFTTLLGMTNVSLLSILLHTSDCYRDSILLLDAHSSHSQACGGMCAMATLITELLGPQNV